MKEYFRKFFRSFIWKPVIRILVGPDPVSERKPEDNVYELDSWKIHKIDQDISPK